MFNKSKNKGKSLKERIASIKEFIKKWKELRRLTQQFTDNTLLYNRIISPDQMPRELEKQYQELREWLIQTYPQIRPEIRKHGAVYSKTELGPGDTVLKIADHDPIINIFNYAPALFDLAADFSKSMVFREEWSAGFTLLNYTLGTLQQALELGGENKLPSQILPANQVVQILSAIRRALRKSFKNPPSCEKDVQDNLDTIFTSLGYRFEREKVQFSYSSKSYKPDFTFPEIGAVVEVKLCKTQNKEKEVIAEINDDIVAYRTQYPILLFVVYDLGFIRDQDGFKNDIIANPNVIVEIVKH